jgi:hypothetical protein
MLNVPLSKSSAKKALLSCFCYWNNLALYMWFREVFCKLPMHDLNFLRHNSVMCKSHVSR